MRKKGFMIFGIRGASIITENEIHTDTTDLLTPGHVRYENILISPRCGERPSASNRLRVFRPRSGVSLEVHRSVYCDFTKNGPAAAITAVVVVVVVIGQCVRNYDAHLNIRTERVRCTGWPGRKFRRSAALVALEIQNRRDFPGWYMCAHRHTHTHTRACAQ